MVELIVGKKGKGKTKVLLDKVNGAVKDANGSIVYLDKSTKHMYELNNKVRLIDVSGFPVKNADEFVGFICGILSQDHDLEQVYLDSFLTTAKLEGKDATETLDQVSAICETFKVSFIISMYLVISLVGAVFFDVAVGVTHGYTGTGVFQHGQVVGTVTEGEAVLQGDGQAVQEKPDTGCLADALLDHLPDAVAVVKVGEMLFTETAEFLNLGIREHMYQEFVKGVGAGFLPAEFVNVYHWNLLAHFFSKGGLGR